MRHPNERQRAVRLERPADQLDAVVGEHVLEPGIDAQRAVGLREVGGERRARAGRGAVECPDVLDRPVPELGQGEADVVPDLLPEVGHAASAGLRLVRSSTTLLAIVMASSMRASDGSTGTHARNTRRKD